MLFSGELETVFYIRGLEKLMMDMVERPEIVNAIVRKLTDFFSRRISRAFDVAGENIDIVGFSSSS